MANENYLSFNFVVKLCGAMKKINEKFIGLM